VKTHHNYVALNLFSSTGDEDASGYDTGGGTRGNTGGDVTQE